MYKQETEITPFSVKRAVVEIAYQKFKPKTFSPEEISLVDFDAALITLGNQKLSPELVQVSISKADQMIHLNKATGAQTIPEASFFLSESREIRQEDRDTIAVAQLIEQQWEEALSRYEERKESGASAQELAESKNELLRVYAADPSCTNLLRNDFIQYFPAELLLEKYGDQKVHLMEVDIPGFGATNNKLGYAVTDKIFRGLAESCEKHFPDATLVRAGGAIIVLSSKEPSPELMAHIREEFESGYSQYRRSVEMSRASFEHGTRESLRIDVESEGQRYTDVNPLRPYLFPSFTTSATLPKDCAGMTVGEMLSSVQWQPFRPRREEITTLSKEYVIANQ